MKRLLLLITLFFFILTSAVSVGFAVYWYRRSQTPVVLSAQKAAPAAEAITTSDMLKKIGTMMQLPAETPTIVTVTDKSKLQGQAFFLKAENGDVVFIFEQARRLILYRPSTEKIIDVAPLVFTNPKSGASPSAELSVSPTPQFTEESLATPSEKEGGYFAQ